MILIVASVFPPEPVISAQVINDLAIRLTGHWKVTVVSPKPTRPYGFSFGETAKEKPKFDHIVLDSYTYPKSKLFGRLRESYSFGKHVASFIRQNNSDIEFIFVHSWPLYGLFNILKESKKYSIRAVTHIVDIYPEAFVSKIPVLNKLLIKALLPIDKFCLRNSAKIVTISPRMKEYLVKSRGLDTKNVEIVYNWQNQDLFINYAVAKKERQENQKFTFMFLGNLSRTASIDTLMNAFALSGIKNSRLIIAGDGSEKDRLTSYASKFKGSSIEFWDAPQMNVPEIQHQADVLLLSLRKGVSLFALPSKLSAYMLSGKPIIACVEEGSDTASVIKNADCGWVVLPENSDNLSDTMKHAASLPADNLKELGENAFNWAYSNFGKEFNLARLVSIFEELQKK